MKDQAQAHGMIDPRIIKFLSTGALNTIFGYAIYASLIFINVPYLAALLAATVAGVIFNYFSFGRLVFRGHSGWPVFAKFIIAYAIIYAANAALLRALTGDFNINAYVAQVICVPPSVALSWILMNNWVYKK